MNGVEPQQLRNIEGDPTATRQTNLRHLRIETVVELVRVYFPDVGMEDFFGEECLFRVIPRDSNARKKILRASTG